MMSRRKLGFFLTTVLFIGGTVAFWSIQNARAAVIVWDGGGATNNWSEDANWAGDVEPGTGDIATFNGTSTKNATIDASISVQGIDINSGYTGTITQGAGFTVTVGTGDFDISDGTFTGGDSAITINDAFTISGGTFNATSGTMSVVTTFTISSGTFNEGTGTVEASGTSNITWNVLTSETFNHLTFNKNGTTVTISSGDTFVVNGTLTLTNGIINTGTVDARGAINQASTFDGGSAIIDFGNDGAGQTYTINGGVAPTIRLNSAADASDSISFAAAATVTHLNATSGFSGSIPVSNPSDFVMTFTTWTQDAGTYDASAQSSWVFLDFNLASGATFTAPDLVTATSVNHVWDVPTSQTFNDFTINGAANLFIANGDTLVVNGTTTLTNGLWSLSGTTGFLDAKGNITQASTFDGGDATINFADDTVAQTYTINGGSGPVIRFDDPDDANDVVSYASNATAMNGYTTTSDFSGTIPISNPSNFALVITNWIQGGGTYDASLQSSWSIKNFDSTGGTFTAPTLVTSTAINDIWDINTTQIFNNFTHNGTAGLRIPDGDTLQVNGTLTLTNGNLDAVNTTGRIEAWGNIVQDSTFDGGDGIIDFGDDAEAQTWTINGTLTPTMRFDDPDDANDEVVFNVASTVNSMTTTAGFSGDIPLTNASNFTLVWSNWNQAGGDYDATGQTNWTLSGDFDRTGGTLTLPTNVLATGNTPTWDFASSQTFTNLTVNNGGFFINVASGDTWTVTGDLTLTNGSLSLASATGTIDVMGNISQASTWDGGTAPIGFGNDAVAQTWTVDGASTNVILLNDPDDANDLVDINLATSIQGVTITSGFSGTVPLDNSGNFTLSVVNWTQDAGTYDASAQTAWNLYNFTRTAGTFVAPQTITSYSTGNPLWDFPTSQTFNNVILNRTNGILLLGSGDTLIVAGDLTLGNGLFNTGSVEVQGDMTVQSTFDGGSTTLTFTGSATQVFDLTGATGLFDADISVNKTGGQVSLASDLVVNANSQDLTIVEGTFDIAGHALSVNGLSSAFTVQDGGVFELFGAETITLNASNPTLSSGSTVRYTGDGDGLSDTYTVTTLKSTYHHLAIGSTDGATDTYQLGAALDINGDFTQTAGTFDVTTSNHAVTVGGNWSNSGTFTARAGTVTLDGGNQSVLGSTVFNNFTKSVSSPTTLTFSSSGTQQFLGTMTLQGSSTSNRLSIRSSTPGTKAKIDPDGSRTAEYLDVQDSDNDNITALTCTVGCFDSGNNENWAFPGIQVGAVSGNTTEAGGTATFSVVLGTQPTNDVTITLDSNDLTEGTVDDTSLTFTNVNWATPQVVTITGQNDDVDDGDIAYTIVIDPSDSLDPAYDNLDPSDVSLSNVDDDTAGVTVSAISGNTTETGGTATFTVVLTSEPTGNVEIDSASADSTEGTVTGGASLTFTSGNWDTPQTVTVTGANDDVDDGNILYTINVTMDAGNTADALYDAINPNDVSVTNTDDDTAGVTITESSGSTSVAELGETSDTYTVVLDSQPTATVTITVTDDTDSNATPTPLTFTTGNWATPQTVTVTAIDDSIDETDPHTSTIAHSAASADGLYSGIGISSVSANVSDDDTSTVLVSAISGNTTEAGGAATFTVVLGAEPTADVTIELDSNDTSEGTVDLTTLTFTSGNWDTPQTVTVTGVNDDIDDGDIAYDIVLDPATSADGTYNGTNPSDVDVTNTDNDTADIVLTESGGSTDVEEGGATDSYTIVLGSEPTADVTITLVSDAEVDADVPSLTFTSANWDTPQTVTVSATDDALDEADTHTGTIEHTVTSVDGVYDGFVVSDVVANVTDDDVAASGGGGGSSVPPTPPPVAPSRLFIEIEDGAARTADADVNVTVNAEGADAYQLSNTTNFSGLVWHPFYGIETTVPWNLGRESGLATVYVRFRGADGTVSGEISDTIEIDPTLEEEEEEEELEPDEDHSEPSTDVSLLGFIRSETDETVYAELANGTVRVVPDLPTLLTYANTCQEVGVVSEDALSTMPLVGSVELNSERVLVKFPDRPEVYAIEDDPRDPWKRVLRWVVNEDVAEQIFGDRWELYVLEIEEDDAYTFSGPITGPETGLMLSELRSTSALQNTVSYELSIVLPDGTRRNGFGPYARVQMDEGGVTTFSFEDRDDGDFNDVILKLDPRDCLTFDISALPLEAAIHHEVWMTVYWGDVPQGDVLVFADSHDGVNHTATVSVSNHTQFTVEMNGNETPVVATGFWGRTTQWIGKLFQ